MSAASPDRRIQAGPPAIDDGITKDAPVTQRQTFRSMTVERAIQIKADMRKGAFRRFILRIMGRGNG